MKTYITFGQYHAHSVNGKTFDKDSVAVIYAEDEKAGRDLAFKYFGNRWFTSYTEDTFYNVSIEYFPRGLIEVNPEQKEQP